MQLRARLKKAYANLDNQSQSTPLGLSGDNIDVEEEDIAVLVEATSGACDGKSAAGNRTVKAYFGRRRTHNEQLIVRTCGVVLSRATMYGSEAISGVHVREFVGSSCFD